MATNARGDSVGRGSSPRASSDADTSIDRGSGKARAAGRGRGGAGSDGRASISIVGNGNSKISTHAGADGMSRGRKATAVAARGGAAISAGEKSIGSVARGKAGQSHVDSRTRLRERSMKADAAADGVSGAKKPGHAATSVIQRLTGGLLGSRIRSSADGDDVSAARTRGKVRVERSGKIVKSISRVELASDKSSATESRQVIISNGKTVYARTTTRARTTGNRLAEPTAEAITAAPQARQETVLGSDRAARRLGEQSAELFMMLELD